MSGSDKTFLGILAFITLWIILFVGEPDLLDTISDRVSGRNACVMDEVK